MATVWIRYRAGLASMVSYCRGVAGLLVCDGRVRGDDGCLDGGKGWHRGDEGGELIGFLATVEELRSGDGEVGGEGSGGQRCEGGGEGGGVTREEGADWWTRLDRGEGSLDGCQASSGVVFGVVKDTVDGFGGKGRKK
ncbi:uncharacterized protein A4U43_C03F24880 [Asparagus officinalis]|uniref:DUF834 domain-containing protein n=1 Tax=Asparagus officinalis TaxID=4686 RepID=A0A5P1FH19_ASPOF|nr:uncharacterized protein A4U43_C03F24880 [Asparagus officinalis]